MDGINPLINATPTAKRTALITATAAIWCGFALLLWTGHANAADPTVDGDLPIDAKSFRCIRR